MKHLGYKTLDQFYQMSSKDISQYGGKALLEHIFNGSISIALQSIYPDHQWLPWKFEQQKVSPGFWDQFNNQKFFIEWLGKELGFKHINDWFNITQKHIQDYGGRGLLFKYGGSPFRLFNSIFPQHNWLPLKDVKTSLKW